MAPGPHGRTTTVMGMAVYRERSPRSADIPVTGAKSSNNAMVQASAAVCRTPIGRVIDKPISARCLRMVQSDASEWRLR
jgi:hypothetical protein